MGTRLEETIGRDEFRRVTNDERLAKSSLRMYLERKYGESVPEYTVLADEPELTFLSWDDGSPIACEKLCYSGCRIAEIKTNSGKAHVLYVISGDAPEYRFGGMDDIEALSFGKAVSQRIADLLDGELDRASVNAGRLVASENGAYILLEGKLEEDWLLMIPSYGIFAAKLAFKAEPGNFGYADSILDKLFEGYSGSSVIVLVEITYPGVEGNKPFVWTNGK